MNIFEKFMFTREVTIKEGEIILDQQRIFIIPLNFMCSYMIKLNETPEEARNLYKAMKTGMIEYSQPLGKEYLLSYGDFLDRWVKYTTLGGWGIVEYQLIEKERNFGFLHVKGSPVHAYLKNKGVKTQLDVIFEGLIAGSLSGTSRQDIDVLETQCVCLGNSVCVYYWGPIDYLKSKFPEEVHRRFGI